MFWINLLENISNNMVSYLTGNEKNQDYDFYGTVFYVLTAITVINLILTYLAINIYLKTKLSQQIMIAERSNLSVQENFISFKKLLIVSFIAGLVSCVHYYQSTSRSDSIPLLNVATCILATLFPLVFVCLKKEVRSFLLRRLMAIKLDHSSLKENNSKQRRIAWEWVFNLKKL